MGNANNTKMSTETQEIVSELRNGTMFENESCGWYTLFNEAKGTLVIVFTSAFTGTDAEDLRRYQSVDTMAKRILELSRRGY